MLEWLSTLLQKRRWHGKTKLSKLRAGSYRQLPELVKLEDCVPADDFILKHLVSIGKCYIGIVA
jgi:hypothetical protein